MDKFLRKFETTTGDFKTIICKKFAKCEIDGVTRNPDEWIIELELVRGDLRKMDVHIDDSYTNKLT